MVLDPITATQLASSVLELTTEAWRLGKALQKLYQDAQNVDETVRNLTSEVSALGDASNLVHEQLEDIIHTTEDGTSSELVYDKDGKLWKCVSTEVEQCLTTMVSLRVIVNGVREQGPNFIAQARRQMKLNKYQPEFVAIRQRVATHTTSLQTILQVINIKISHLAPGRATNELRPRLDDLAIKIQTLQDTMEAIKQQGSLPPAGNTLIDCAKEVMRSGATLYEASVADGSICGGPLAADGNIRVAAWVSALESLHQTNLSDTHGTPSVFSDEHRYTGSSGETPPTAYEATFNSDVHVDEDIASDEDDFELTMAKTALDEGALAFEKREWAEANSLLQEAVSILQQIPRKSAITCDTFDLQYKLAVCAYHVQDPTVAEEALTSLTQQMPSNNEQRRIICDALYLLAQLYIRIGKLDLARSSCDTAGKGRRRLLGKDNDAYLETLALSSHIYSLQGNAARGKIVSRMIPSSRREVLMALVDDLLSTQTVHQVGRDAAEGEDSPISSSQLDDKPEEVNTVTREQTDINASKCPAPVKAPKSDLAKRPASTVRIAASSLPQQPAAASSSTPSLNPVELHHRTLPTSEHDSPEVVKGGPVRRTTPLNRLETATTREDHGAGTQPIINAPVNTTIDSSFDVPSTALLNTNPDDSAPNANDAVSNAVTVSESDLVRRKPVKSPTSPKGTRNVVRSSNIETNGNGSGSTPMDAQSRLHTLARLQIEPKTELQRLICVGRLDTAMALLQVKPNYYVAFDPQRPEQPNAMHFAVLFGDLDIARKLVTKGIHSSCHMFRRYLGEKSCHTALDIAIGMHRIPMLQLLLDAGDGFPPKKVDLRLCMVGLFFEMKQRFFPDDVISTLQFLHEHGWTFTDTPADLCYAIQLADYGNHNFVYRPLIRFLLKVGVPVLPKNPQQPHFWGGDGYKTADLPLHFAIHNNHADVVPLLLQTRPQDQLRVRQEHGMDPLSSAISRALWMLRFQNLSIEKRNLWLKDFLEIARTLLKAGADVNTKGPILYLINVAGFEKSKLVYTSALACARNHPALFKELIPLLESYASSDGSSGD